MNPRTQKTFLAITAILFMIVSGIFMWRQISPHDHITLFTGLLLLVLSMQVKG